MGGYVVAKNRLVKAKKIEAVLVDHFQKKICGFSILDIGTGTGEIAAYFAPYNEVFAVDVENQLTETTNGVKITLREVDSEVLPFEDRSFDIIISNHVIEHVGIPLIHLQEMKRCLKCEGVVYFSTPNRIFPKEPHTKTWFIHYLPYKMFFRSLKLIRNKRFTEPVYLLTYWRQKRLFIDSGFKFKEYTREVLNNPNKYHLDERIPFRVPKCIQAVSKTNIFLLY